MEANHHILQSAQPRKETHILEGATYPLINNLVGPHFQKFFLPEDDLPVIRLVEPGNDIKGCGLPRSVGPDEAEDLTLHYVEIDFIECLETAKTYRKIPYLK